MERVREEKRRKKKIKKKESLRRKKIQVREKVGKSWKVAKHRVFPMICGSGGSTSRLAKAAGAEPCGDEKLHAVVA